MCILTFSQKYKHLTILHSSCILTHRTACRYARFHSHKVLGCKIIGAGKRFTVPMSNFRRRKTATGTVESWFCVWAINWASQVSYLKQNDAFKCKEARLCLSVTWFQYLHREKVTQTIFPCSLACKKGRKTYTKVWLTIHSMHYSHFQCVNLRLPLLFPKCMI